MDALEIWGGIECTFNRVGDQYFDQCQKNGHSKRIGDLKLFSEIGIKKIRYPCLWETVAMDSPDELNWQQLDERLNQLKDLAISPVAGFLHHGSGPRYTSLLDPKFPEMLAEYAGKFAARYSWIEDFTPVNEILTTARFSCLYGHWYPHHNNDHSFLMALFNQCKATVLAMKEIRKIIPYAKLIQPEDIGKCQSTEKLFYQRDFENERRWLAYDVLCGKFDSSHALYKYVTDAGIDAADIEWAKQNPCPPDILGINHYLLSNRYLDDKLTLYPSEFHGGNGIHTYADVGVLDTGQAGLPLAEDILKETWERYHIPLAVTEVHTRGYREEQVRWLYKMWTAALNVKREGVDIKAVTAWSLLGSFDWHSLCTRDDMFYEPGVFELDARTGMPRYTALARLVQDLAGNGETGCPFLEKQIDWPSDRRIIFAAKLGSFSPLKSAGRPILIDVRNYALRKMFSKVCSLRNLAYEFFDHEDGSDIHAHNPWAILKLDHDSTHDLIFTAYYARQNEEDRLVLKTRLHHFNENFAKFIHSTLDLLIDGPEEKTFHFTGEELVSLHSMTMDKLNIQRSTDEKKNRNRRSGLCGSSAGQGTGRKRKLFGHCL